MNRYAPHVYVIPEDDANRQIADGFVLHHEVRDARIQVVPPAGGWPNVLETFREEYLPKARAYPNAHVVMLIDFDGQVERRRAEFEQAIPDDLRARVFVIGPQDEPEVLRKALRIGFEEIGAALAGDCFADTTALWDHEQLRHNDPERQRLVQIVRPFLF